MKKKQPIALKNKEKNQPIDLTNFASFKKTFLPIWDKIQEDYLKEEEEKDEEWSIKITDKGNGFLIEYFGDRNDTEVMELNYSTLEVNNDPENSAKEREKAEDFWEDFCCRILQHFAAYGACVSVKFHERD